MEFPDPVLYVRKGIGGGLECEVWYFASQFFSDNLIKKVLYKLPQFLLDQLEEPKFVHGNIGNQNWKEGQKKKKKPLLKETKERWRREGFCEECGAPKQPQFLRCNTCLSDARIAKKIRANEAHKKKQKKIQKLNLKGGKETEVANLRQELGMPIGAWKEAKIPQDNPTNAQPGSRDKVAILAWRYKEGYVLFNPNDNSETISRDEDIAKRFDSSKFSKAQKEDD